MFTPATHPRVGEILTYLPHGSSPYAYDGNLHPSAVLMSGEAVRVLSAWSRDYLPNGGAPLLYVECLRRGTRTHVTPDTLKIMGV